MLRDIIQTAAISEGKRSVTPSCRFCAAAMPAIMERKSTTTSITRAFSAGCPRPCISVATEQGRLHVGGGADAPEPLVRTMRKNLPIGSINRVIDRLLEEIEVLRPDQIAIQTQLGDLNQRTMLRQIELWGDRIIPAVQKSLGQPDT